MKKIVFLIIVILFVILSFPTYSYAENFTSEPVGRAPNSATVEGFIRPSVSELRVINMIKPSNTTLKIESMVSPALTQVPKKLNNNLKGPSSLAELAKVDLVARLGVRSDEIVTKSIIEKLWPDGSWGCPKKGESYTQALVAGYLITLEVKGKEYYYHSDLFKVKFCSMSYSAFSAHRPNLITSALISIRNKFITTLRRILR